MSKLKKAIEKAKLQRGDESSSLMSLTEVFRETSLESAPDEIRIACEDVNPTYSITRRVAVDPGQIRGNRCFTFFHDEAASDQFKILRTQILTAMESMGGNSLLITSANPREGKTLTAINLAISMAHKIDQTVLLVDANLKHPSIHQYFSIDVQEGLSDYLLKKAEIPDLLLNPGLEKLVLLPGGNPLPNSAELLGAPRMASLVKEMKERYADRFIIFDSSSLLTYADALVFSEFIDGVLLVVEMEKTARKDITRVVELLKNKPLIGTVLNKVK